MNPNVSAAEEEKKNRKLEKPKRCLVLLITQYETFLSVRISTPN